MTTCHATVTGVDVWSMYTCSRPEETNASTAITMPRHVRNKNEQEPRKYVMHGYSACSTGTEQPPTGIKALLLVAGILIAVH